MIRLSVEIDKTEERIRRIFGRNNATESPRVAIVEDMKQKEEMIENHSDTDRHKKMIDFIKLSAQLRSEINKTTDPMKALELSLQCVSIYLDDNDFFYRSNRNRLIGGS